MSRQAQIFNIPTSSLRPTQATVGFREVRRKRAEWRAHVTANGFGFIAKHVVPVVLGPVGRHYAIDHHHLARALCDEGVETLAVKVAADASALSEAEFWKFLERRSWGHPFDADGRPLAHPLMPRTLADMTDDPYRSLAGALRRAGGYPKGPAPCSEFAWADFLRSRIDDQMLRDDFGAALDRALRLCRRGGAALIALQA